MLLLPHEPQSSWSQSGGTQLKTIPANTNKKKLLIRAIVILQSDLRPKSSLEKEH